MLLVFSIHVHLEKYSCIELFYQRSHFYKNLFKKEIQINGNRGPFLFQYVYFPWQSDTACRDPTSSFADDRVLFVNLH